MNGIRKILPQWVNEGLISKEQAENIEVWLEKRRSKGPGMFTIIAALGALLLVAGLVLILSNSWYNFSHGLQLFLAICPALAAGIFTWFVLHKFSEIKAWREIAGIVSFFALGASVGLIANVYHTETTGPLPVLNWLICAAPVMFVLNSRLSFILYFVYATWYALVTGYDQFAETSAWHYSWMLGLTFLFLIYDQRSVRANWFYIALSWIFPIALLWLMGIFSSHSNYPGLNFLNYIGAMACLLLFSAKTDSFTGNVTLNGVKMIPRLTLLFILAAFGLADLWDKVVYNGLVKKVGFQNDFLFWLSSTVVVFSVLAGLRSKYQKKQILQPEIWAAWLFVAVFYAVGFAWHQAAMWFVTAIMLYVGANYVNRGIKSNRLPVLNYGLLWLAVALLCRIVDVSQSNLTRGLIFMATGLALLIFNLVFMRNKRREATNA